MKKNLPIIAFIILVLLPSAVPAQVKPGIETLLQRIEILHGKRVGLITNPSGVNSKLEATVDILFDHQVHLTALFAPEHGLRGDRIAGEKIFQETDPYTKLPVYSLYGSTQKPTTEMLQNVDVLVFDIQDIGVRPYTYIYTMALAMQAASEHNIPFIILDRPNPLGGLLVDGPVLDPAFKSFIGLYPIPYIHGMTIGELGMLFNQEYGIHADVTVMPMQGWQRGMHWSDTGLIWIPTSTHIPHCDTPFFCAATGAIGELHTLNCGVGYTMPFELVAAPWIDAKVLSADLNNRRLKGVYFRPVTYRPFYSIFENRKVHGVQIQILDLNKIWPVQIQVHILSAIRKNYPDMQLFNNERRNMFDNAMGTDLVRKQIERGVFPEQIISGWQAGLQEFIEIRKKYLIY